MKEMEKMEKEKQTWSWGDVFSAVAIAFLIFSTGFAAGYLACTAVNNDVNRDPDLRYLINANGGIMVYPSLLLAVNNTYDYNTSSMTGLVSDLSDGLLIVLEVLWDTLGTAAGAFFASQPATSPWILVFVLVIVGTAYIMARRFDR